MPFEAKSDQYEAKQFLGFYLSEDQASHLKLVALSEGYFINSLLKNIALEYLKQCPTQRKLIMDLAESAIKEWDELFGKKQGKPGWRNWKDVGKRWDAFLKRTEQNLSRRKLPEEITRLIVEEICKIEMERR